MAIQQKCYACGQWNAERVPKCRSCGKGVKPRGLVQWRADRVDGAGRRIRAVCGSWASARKVDLAIQDSVLAQARYGVTRSHARLGALADEYLSDERIAAGRDFRVRRNCIAGIVSRLGQDRALSTLTPQVVHAYQQARQQAGITNSTINRECRYLSLMLDWHAVLGRVEANPVRGYRSLPENEARERILGAEERAALWDALPMESRPLAALLAALPLRFHEAVMLQWEQGDGTRPWIDLGDPRRGYIVIPKGVSKSGRPRDIPIYYAELRAMLAALPSRFRRGGVFLRADGRPMTGPCFREQWRAACAMAGVRDLRIHDLRHTAITWLLLYGVPAVDVADDSDHASAGIQQRYTNVKREHKRTLRDRFYNPATGLIEDVERGAATASPRQMPEIRNVYR